MRNCIMALVALLLISGAAQAGQITVMSGGGNAPGTLDPAITMLVGDADAGFSAFVPADFAAADTGPSAFVIPNHSAWKAHLDAPNAAAEYIGTASNAQVSNFGNSALFSMEVDFGPAPLLNVTLDFYYLVDNVVGDDNNEGLFMNGAPVAGTKNLAVVVGNFQTDQSFTGLDVTSMVTPGLNRFYVNMGDRGGAGGIQFSAVFTTTPDQQQGNLVPLPGAAWAGLGLMGLLMVGRRFRRRA